MKPANHETELTDAYLDALQARVDRDARKIDAREKEVPRAIDEEQAAERAAEAECREFEQRRAEKDSEERREKYEAVQAERKTKLEELKNKVEAATVNGHAISDETEEAISAVFGDFQKTTQALGEIGWRLLESDLYSGARGFYLFTTAEVDAQVAKDEAEMAAKATKKAKSSKSSKSSKSPKKPPKGRGFFKPARRIARSPEAWRGLKDYPAYEISSHGRVRCVDRVSPEDCLKPRYRFFRGQWSLWIRLSLKGVKYERQIPWLMVAAGYLDAPKRKQDDAGGVRGVGVEGFIERHFPDGATL